MKKIIFYFLILILIMTGCNEQSTIKLEKFSENSITTDFDSFITLVSYEESKEDFDKNFNTTKEYYSLYNDYFDIYENIEGLNNIKTINDNAGIAPVKVDDIIIELLLDAKEFYEISNNKFDVTFGAVLKVWHDYRSQGISLNLDGQLAPIPTEEELLEAASCTGWQYVEIDEQNSTVYINNPCVSLDVGGIAKGFAAEKIAQELSNTTYAGIINAGGNTRTINSKPDGTPWVSGIENPNGDGSLLIVTTEGSNSAVTSGDYQRYFIGEDEKKYHHIIDPESYYPSSYYRAISIFTLNSGDADILSTTLFSLSIEEGKKVLDNYNSLYPDTPAEAIWIMENDENKQEDENGFVTKDFYVTSTDGIKNNIETTK